MKWIAISGCDSGFGAIMVEKIKAMEGVGIFAGCFLQDTVRTLNSEQRDDVKAIILDVTNETSVLSFAATITEHLGSSGQLAGLVNNAGILINPGPTEWTPLHTYKKMFDVNVLGTVSLTKACLPLIRASQGRIVNVASIAGRTGLPSEPAYCASKYAVEGYSDVLRRDMLAWGVTVHIIEPGIFPNTGLYDRFQTGLDDLWNDLSPELQAEYGESYYQNFRERIGKSLGLGNSDSSLVPTAMLSQGRSRACRCVTCPSSASTSECSRPVSPPRPCGTSSSTTRRTSTLPCWAWTPALVCARWVRRVRMRSTSAWCASGCHAKR